MNNYVRLSHPKGDVTGVGTDVNATLDPAYLRQIERASREVDGFSKRHFFTLTGTRYYAGTGTKHLYLRDDLVSASAVAVDEDGDGTYELTLSEDTDYWLAPYEAADINEPYWELEINPNSDNISRWPRYPRSIKVTGVFGWPETLDSVGTLGASLNNSATSVTMASGHDVQVGDMLKVDSESIYVTDLVGETLTVQRGQNGSTSAAHDSASDVYVFRFPPAIEEAVAIRTANQRWDNAGGMPMGEPAWQGGTDFAKYRGLISPFVRRVF